MSYCSLVNAFPSALITFRDRLRLTQIPCSLSSSPLDQCYLNCGGRADSISSTWKLLEIQILRTNKFSKLARYQIDIQK